MNITLALAWAFGVLCGWLFFLWYNYRDRDVKPPPHDNDEIFW